MSLIGAMDRVLDSLVITGPRSFRLFGLHHGITTTRASSGAGTLHRDGEKLLATVLYGVLHCRASEVTQRLGGVTDSGGLADFVEHLSEANVGTGRYASGWVAREFRPDGSTLAEFDGVRFEVAANDYRAPGSRQPGDRIAVWIPKEQRYLWPGFYVGFSDADDSKDDTTVRLYWHIDPAGAPVLVHGLTQRLNSGGCAFMLKVLADPLHYPRADAAVLYLAAGDYHRVKPIIRAVYENVRDMMFPSASVLTKELAPGLGFAESPQGPLSFGEHRCDLLATILHKAVSYRPTDKAQSLQYALNQLRELGYDPERPFLNPGSSDRYD
jgi:hypothetical protein